MKSTKTMTRLLVALGALALLAAPACDSDSNTNAGTDAGATDNGAAGDDTTGADQGGATDDTAATDDGGSTDTGAGTDTGGGTGGGACMNAADLAISRDEASAKAAHCGKVCLAEADPGTCSQTCVVQDTGLTDACAQCYTDTILCSISNCIPACLTPDSEACQTCQAENCTPAYFTCTGYEWDCGDGVDENGDGNTDCDDPSCAGDAACAQ